MNIHIAVIKWMVQRTLLGCSLNNNKTKNGYVLRGKVFSNILLVITKINVLLPVQIVLQKWFVMMHNYCVTIALV